MESHQIKLEIIEPSASHGESDIYFNGKDILSLNGTVAKIIGLTQPDEYLIFSRLGTDIYIAKKPESAFGFRARMRNSKKIKYYLTSIDLKKKIGFTKNTYAIESNLEQDGIVWHKLTVNTDS